MSIGTISPSRVFAIKFSNCGRWDPGSYHRIDWHWPSEVMAPISEVLGLRKEKVDRKKHKFSELMPITIHFDGSIEPRNVDASKEYSMELFWARPGDIIVSKIDLKNGAVGIVPDQWGNVVVTGHFAVYKPKTEKICPAYFHQLIQTRFFKEHLWKNKVGAEGRKEVKLDFFESVKIPIPLISVQRKIADYWQRATQEIKNSELQIQEWKDNIARNILDDFSIRIELGNILPRVFVFHFGSSERWGVSFNRYCWDLKSLIQTNRYPKAPLGEYAWINPGNSVQLKADDKVTFVPMEGVDQKDGYICKPETRKFRQVKSGFTRFKNGDVIWAKITPCMQNGKSAIVSNLISCVAFGSTEFHVIRTKNASNLRSEYIHLLLRMPEIRNAATRYFVGSAGQQRVPKEFLENLHIPILPINVQEKLISMAKSDGTKIAEKRKIILARREKHMETFEKMILGLRPVEDIENVPC
jgi:type I restriction enzyme S subunit